MNKKSVAVLILAIIIGAAIIIATVSAVQLVDQTASDVGTQLLDRHRAVIHNALRY